MKMPSTPAPSSSATFSCIFESQYFQKNWIFESDLKNAALTGNFFFFWNKGRSCYHLPTVQSRSVRYWYLKDFQKSWKVVKKKPKKIVALWTEREDFEVDKLVEDIISCKRNHWRIWIDKYCQAITENKLNKDKQIWFSSVLQFLWLVEDVCGLWFWRWQVRCRYSWGSGTKPFGCEKLKRQARTCFTWTLRRRIWLWLLPSVRRSVFRH